jgi:predicted RecA/RadA family phage recombinase
MAQSGFTLSDEGRTITVCNDSGTTAIVTGDLLCCATNNDVMTGTAASARNAYAGGDILVKRMADSATGYKTTIGVALEDIPADGYGAAAMEGVFIHPVSADTEAGQALFGAASANKVVKITDAVMASATTTGMTNIKTSVDNQRYKVGRALTGGSTDGKYIVWKMTV